MASSPPAGLSPRAVRLTLRGLEPANGPGERDERLQGRKTITVTEPEPDETSYDLTIDPFEERNFAHPAHADDRSEALQRTMLGLLHEQLAAKRLTPAAGAVPGYRPPVSL